MTCVQRRSAHRIRGTTLVVGTGGAVRPFTLCLSAQGARWTDPTIAPAFDGLKYSRLSQGRVCRPLPAAVVLWVKGAGGAWSRSRSISAVLQKRTLANTSLWVQSTVPVNPRHPGVNRVNLL